MLKLIFKYIFWLAIACALTFSISALRTENSNSSTTALQVWVKDSLEHVRLEDSGEKTQDIHLYAARGEYESFQIAIKANQPDLAIANVKISPLIGNGSKINPDNVTLYREHYVNITKPSPSSIKHIVSKVKSLGAGWYPDGLIPFVDPETKADLVNAEIDAVPFKIQPGRDQVIWLDIFVPRDAAAGDYQGTYSVVSNDETITGQILLTVWNFELPLKPSLQSSFLSWEQNDRGTLVELLKHRVMPAAKINPQDERELIDRWGLSSLRLPFWSGANYHNCSMSPAPSTAEVREAGLEHQLDLMLYAYPTDEIDGCNGQLDKPFREWATNIKQAGVPHLAAMVPEEQFYDVVDIWAVNPERYTAAGKKIVDVLKRGKKIWFYTFFSPRDNSPTWLIDFAPINHRVAQGFINQRLGITGLLYWRVDTWTEDPWRNVDTNANLELPEHYPGEGMLIYPGKQVGIKGSVASMRLKWIRDGVEDYEYIEILKNTGHYTWAMETIAEVAQDMYTWNQDPAVLQAVRLKLGQKISELS
ncbi:MAG: DUF4091 domain-containing protein [Cyanobacteria bacterium J06600_6]